MFNKHLKEFLSTPVEKRRQMKFGVKRGLYNKPRGEFTCDELVLWAKSNNVRTVAQLKKNRGFGDPNLNSFVKAFGSWSEFKKVAFGSKPEEEVGGKTPADPLYILKLMVANNICTAEQYRKLRCHRPDIVPSINQVYGQFGRWTTATYWADRLSVTKTAEKYIRMRDRLGRWPTPTECKQARIDIAKLVSIHDGSKKALDAFLEKMERLDEERRTSPGTV